MGLRLCCESGRLELVLLSAIQSDTKRSRYEHATVATLLEARGLRLGYQVGLLLSALSKVEATQNVWVHFLPQTSSILRPVCFPVVLCESLPSYLSV